MVTLPPTAFVQKLMSPSIWPRIFAASLGSSWCWMMEIWVCASRPKLLMRLQSSRRKWSRLQVIVGGRTILIPGMREAVTGRTPSEDGMDTEYPADVVTVVNPDDEAPPRLTPRARAGLREAYRLTAVPVSERLSGELTEKPLQSRVCTGSKICSRISAAPKLTLTCFGASVHTGA